PRSATAIDKGRHPRSGNLKLSNRGGSTMIVYFNYPNSYISFHYDPDCSTVGMHRKAGQRFVTVTMQSLPAVLADFIAKKYQFAANSALNDLYLDVSLNTPHQEETIVPFIRALLNERYSR